VQLIEHEIPEGIFLHFWAHRHKTIKKPLQVGSMVVWKPNTPSQWVFARSMNSAPDRVRLHEVTFSGTFSIGSRFLSRNLSFHPLFVSANLSLFKEYPHHAILGIVLSSRKLGIG
jgi:hypothetical protein